MRTIFGNLHTYLRCVIDSIALIYLRIKIKRRGGKQSLVMLCDQKEAFSKYKDYFAKENDLPSSSDQIFSTISKELQCRMSEKALYISLRRNFSYFFGSDNLSED